MQNGFKIVYTFTGQTVWDIATQQYGSISAVWKILSDNQSLSVDTVIPANTPVIIDINFKSIPESFDESSIKITPKRKSSEIALENQNIWDFALQEYGTIEAVFELMAANNINGLDSNLTTNKRYKLPNTINIQKHIQEHYTKSEIKVVTGKFAVLIGNYDLREDGGYELREDGGKSLQEIQ
jgi:hypothetical protein